MRLQAKLTVGEPDDEYEREADRIAGQMATVPANAAATMLPPRIQRFSAREGGGGMTAPASVERVLANPGSPLEPGLRQEMEGRFGQDFRGVRIHQGAEAARSARDIDARAYTVGRHIGFGDGEFSPSTPGGRRLLAHELTHVVQQSSDGGTVQRDFDALTKKAAPLELPTSWDDNGTPFSQHTEILWQAVVSGILMVGDDFWLDLAVVLTPEKRARLSSQQLASECAWPLFDAIPLPLSNNGKGLIGYLAAVFEKWKNSASYIFTLKTELLRGEYDGKAFDAYWKNLESSVLGPAQKRPSTMMVTAADIPEEEKVHDEKKSDGKKPKYVPPPPWVTSKTKALDALLAKLRQQPHERPKDLPDRVVPWHKEADDTWFLNVWVYLDAQGKEKTVQAIRLKENESAEDLLARVRGADRKTLENLAAAEEQQRQRAMPAWALQLKQKLEQRLHQVTGGKPADDAPDRLSLAYGGPKAGQNAPGGGSTPAGAEGTPDQVMLQVWVGIGEKKTTGNAGSVPIQPTTDVEKLLVFVRQLAAVLRQNEATPQGDEISPWEKTDRLNLPPFDAKILAMDLQPNHITVQGAQNKFSMFLDFAKQYGANDDLFIASKLFSQAIFFRWRVLPVPLRLTAFEENGQPPAWDKQWRFLYEHYNPGASAGGGEIIATHTAGAVPEPTTEPVYDERDDMTARVKLDGPPGDYLVYCQTLHRPIGESGLRRVSSYAYYPVRTRSVADLTTPMVTQTPAAIAAADTNLKSLDEALAAKDLPENRKKLLLAARASTQSQRDVLETRETRDLATTTSAEIRDGTARLAITKRLKARLQDVLEKAKAKPADGVKPPTPSELLEGEPELLNLYWQLIREGKSVVQYEHELEDQLKQLQGVNERAGEFQKNFKSDEAACVYSPEAVFLSEVDGHMYPLILTVGEARNQPLGGVAYIVADVTSRDTQKEYYGFSGQTGPAGHIEAIDNAFENFGEDATYGEGWIAVRMPPRGPREECRPLHRHEIKTYRSKEGIAEKVWRALGFLAAAVAVAALVATGFGAVVLGVLATVIGAAVALHNIGERSARHTLEFDAELGMDILSILPIGELAAVRELSTLSKAAHGFEAAQRLGRFLAVYRAVQMGAGFALIPIKMVQDIDKIRELHLPKDQEDKLIRQVIEGAVQGGLMFLLQVGASHVMAGGHGTVSLPEEQASIHQQAELASLENQGDYQSLQEKGWLDEHGNWTKDAPESIRQRQVELAGGEAPFDPAHPGGAPAAPPSAERVAAANEGVGRVEHGEAEVKGDPGERHADLRDGHEIVEKRTADGIVCEYHSSNPIPVHCPTVMGDHVEPPAHAAGEPASPAAGHPAPAVEHPAALDPQTLVDARQRERAAQTRRENLHTGIKAKERSNQEAREFIEARKETIEAYKQRRPKAGPGDETLRKHQQVVDNFEAGIKTREREIADANKEIAVLDGQLTDLAQLKAKYAASKPWREVPLTDEVRGGLVGELEMSTLVQGENYEPLGKTVRADTIKIPEDFEGAVKNWRGKTGIDGVYKRPHPDRPGKFQYAVAESKTTGLPATREPTGTRGKLATMKTGERQLSDQWIRDRLDTSELSPADRQGFREALETGELQKFYAETDANGTRLYEVKNVNGSETDVLIGKQVVF